MRFLELRQPGYDLLRGEALEIGAFEHPARLPHVTRLIRCDRIGPAEAAAIFAEVDAQRLPPVDVRLDLDRDGLAAFPDHGFDAAVCCHVLEHLVNPLQALGEIFRVLRPGAQVALAVPDHRFTSDRRRAVTTWPEVVQRYRDRRTEPKPADYLDFVRGVEPQMLEVPAAQLDGYLHHLWQRREHLNVWDTSAFRDLLARAAAWFERNFEVAYEVPGEVSQFEAFVVLRLT